MSHFCTKTYILLKLLNLTICIPFNNSTCQNKGLDYTKKILEESRK